ncbi:MAG: hypothetical protein DRQ78_08260 [Epsilonproteobacteria bacterium]|nr:MAG: hypothetical protein DRQ78_08260 [Campylobacterota bacterium]
MKLKMRVSDILLACDQYRKTREVNQRDLYDLLDADDIMWSQIKENRDDDFFINLKRMAEYAEQSEYPYLIVSVNEFNRMETYL